MNVNNDILLVGDSMCFRRKAVLFIHGFVGGVYDYNNYPNELEIYRNFDVYTFTLPGHDKTVVKNVKYEDWINAAEEQMEFLLGHGYKNIYVIGHSMGGVIAAHLASKYNQVKKVVLVAPAFRYLDFKDGKVNIRGISDSFKDIPEMFKNMGTEVVFERFQKTPIPTLIEFTKLVSNYEKDLESITCPILTIRGLSDKVVPEESVKLVYDNVKSKTNILINIDEVTHDCFRKKRCDELKQLITQFLRKKVSNKKEKIDI